MTSASRQLVLNGTLLLLIAAAAPAHARAGDLFGLRWRHAMAARPSIARPVPTVPLAEVPTVPESSYALPPNRPFPWGSFGAQTRPYNVYHKSYWGTYRDWSYRPGL